MNKDEGHTTRWRESPKSKWKYTSNFFLEHEFSEERARVQLDEDIKYFYDDIEIQLVKVTVSIIETHRGSNQRRMKK